MSETCARPLPLQTQCSKCGALARALNPFAPFPPAVTGLLYSTLGTSYTRKYNYVAVSIARKCAPPPAPTAGCASPCSSPPAACLHPAPGSPRHRLPSPRSPTLCLAPLRRLMYDAAVKAFPVFKNVPIDTWPGVANDGLNEAGLGLSLQWQRATTGMPTYNVLRPGPSLDIADAANYILASFASVAEVKAAFAKGLTVHGAVLGGVGRAAGGAGGLEGTLVATALGRRCPSRAPRTPALASPACPSVLAD